MKEKNTVIAIFGTAVAVLIAAVAVAAAVKSNVFRIEREIRIDAPPEQISPFINNFRNWISWSPYENLDPAMVRLFSGPVEGTGAIYAWDSQGRAGSGRMIIREATPARIAIDLEFIKPFACQNVAEFTLRPAGGSTTVTWSMSGPNPYLWRLIGTFFDVHAMVGKDFEKGLASLKSVAEAERIRLAG